MALLDTFKSIYNTTEKTAEKAESTFEKMKPQINPYLNRNGELVNKYIDYQKALDNPNTTPNAKKFITQATGLTPTQTAAETNSNGGYTGQNWGKKGGSTNKVGFISAKYESNGDGGMVSSGAGDYGGVSYGVVQFSSTQGSAQSFVNWLKQANPQMGNAFGNYKPGTAEFGTAWKQTYKQYGEAFTDLQNQYAYDNFVKPLADLAYKKTGVDYTRSVALREMLFSTAIQFGGGSLGLKALGNVNANMSDTELINASYDNKINNYKSYYRSSSSAVQEGVRSRWINEKQDVLALVGTNSTAVANRSSGSSSSNTIVNAAEKYMGTPYVWGGESMAEGGMDCSGFVYNALKDAGYNVGRLTAQGYRAYGKTVSKADMQPGDLVFFGSKNEATHIGIYIGNGQMIHSSGGSKNTKSNPGKGVCVTNVNNRSDFIEARRY